MERREKISICQCQKAAHLIDNAFFIYAFTNNSKGSLNKILLAFTTIMCLPMEITMGRFELEFKKMKNVNKIEWMKR
jgi:hypothetical protein